jgi:hypothetical protein
MVVETKHNPFDGAVYYDFHFQFYKLYERHWALQTASDNPQRRLGYSKKNTNALYGTVTLLVATCENTMTRTAAKNLFIPSYIPVMMKPFLSISIVWHENLTEAEQVTSNTKP